MTHLLPYPTLSSSFSHARAAGDRLTDFAKANPLLATGAAVVVGLAATALINNRAARKAERDNPPAGTFLTIDGCRLHYVEQGEGEPLVLLHGNGSMIQDFKSSGLVDSPQNSIACSCFDRPGYGHSDRPRTSIWTADLQADLIRKALQRLNIPRAIVLGHSWGASVAVALALKHPEMVRGLVLASGALLSNAPRRHDHALGPGSSGDRRYHPIHDRAAAGPIDMARNASQDFWAAAGAGQVRRFSQGDGASSIANQGVGCRCGPTACSCRAIAFQRLTQH